MATSAPCVDALVDADDATAALILKLQTDDLVELASQNKGKGREDELSDAELAFDLYKEEVEERDRVRADRCMARSVMQAVIFDASILSESANEEHAASQDRALALRLSGNSSTTTPAPNPSNTDFPDGFLARLAAMYVASKDEELDACESMPVADSEPRGESSSWAAGRSFTRTPTYRQCISCVSEKRLFEVVQTPCGHYYCQGCLQTLFELASTDETLFPPRCCREEIPLPTVKIYLPPPVVEFFEKKAIEFRTVDRTYCSQSTCSSFIDPSIIVGDEGTCHACGSTTCTLCKSEAHHGMCPEDRMTQEILELALQEGWQRCYQCRRLVELDHGCNHMTCLCGGAFCYLCGLQWKTCNCPQWDDYRLLARAHQVVDRAPPQEEAARERRVGQVLEDLRERHDCAPHEWRFRRRPARCEECRTDLPQFIFECTQCHILACKRCSTNRL